MTVEGLCGVFIPGWVGAVKWRSSETSASRTQTPGNYLKRNKLRIQPFLLKQ